MTTLVAAFDAKQKLSELLSRTVEGEDFVITRHGIPVARLVPVHHQIDRNQLKQALLARLQQQDSLNRDRIDRASLYDQP